MRGTSGHARVFPKFSSARCGSLNPTVMKNGFVACVRMNLPVAAAIAATSRNAWPLRHELGVVGERLIRSYVFFGPRVPSRIRPHSSVLAA